MLLSTPKTVVTDYSNDGQLTYILSWEHILCSLLLANPPGKNKLLVLDNVHVRLPSSIIQFTYLGTRYYTREHPGIKQSPQFLVFQLKEKNKCWLRCSRRNNRRNNIETRRNLPRNDRYPTHWHLSFASLSEVIFWCTWHSSGHAATEQKVPVQPSSHLLKH